MDRFMKKGQPTQAEIASFFRLPPDTPLDDILPPPPGLYKGPTVRGTSAGERLTEEDYVSLMKVALKWTEAVWSSELHSLGVKYSPPTLVIFKGTTTSASGPIYPLTGPVYDPLDRKLYIDPTFFQFLEQIWDGPNDVAMMYIVFHEVSHHVQKILSITTSFAKKLELLSDAEAITYRLAFELQGDYLAGYALQRANKKELFLHDTDPEALYWLAVTIGDDLMQLRNSGRITPDAFPHGTGTQRARVFWAGFTRGSLKTGLDFQFFLDLINNKDFSRL